MFGLKVSKSSVGRYHQAEILGKVRRKKEECRKGGSGKAGEEVSGWARDMCIGMLAGRGTPNTEEAYQKTLTRMTRWALAEMQWPVEDERDVKGVLRVMRILISATRERNEADMMKLARLKFEMRAARECFKYLRVEEAKRQSKVQRCLRTATKPKVGRALANGQRDEGLRRGEKDPMMTWNFPDGEIRRMPLMRQAGPARIQVRNSETSASSVEPCEVRNEPRS
jgi:hypothetical protein